MNIVLNLTTGHYFVYNNQIQYRKKIKKFLKKLNAKTAINKIEIGESFWKKDDTIIIVPNHLFMYVGKEFNQV